MRVALTANTRCGGGLDPDRLRRLLERGGEGSLRERHAARFALPRGVEVVVP